MRCHDWSTSQGFQGMIDGGSKIFQADWKDGSDILHMVDNKNDNKIIIIILVVVVVVVVVFVVVVVVVVVVFVVANPPLFSYLHNQHHQTPREAPQWAARGVTCSWKDQVA